MLSAAFLEVDARTSGWSFCIPADNTGVSREKTNLDAQSDMQRRKVTFCIEVVCLASDSSEWLLLAQLPVLCRTCVIFLTFWMLRVSWDQLLGVKGWVG